MAGTISTASSVLSKSSPMRYLRIDWTSDASGNVEQTISQDGANGVAWGSRFIPGTDSDQPTDQYDVTLKDANGLDVLNGTGANLSNSAAASKTPDDTGTLPVVGPLTFEVADAGNAKKGSVILYLV